MSDTSKSGTERSLPLVERFGLHNMEDDEWWDGTPRVSEEFVCGVAEVLEAGDEVILNDRSRSLEVLGFEEQTSDGYVSGSDWPYHVLWLRGNGTEYRLRWSHLCEHNPRLHTESELETRESYSVKHGEKRKRTIAETSGTRVHWICPVDVDRDELVDWVLSRSIEGLEEWGRSQDGDHDE